MIRDFLIGYGAFLLVGGLGIWCCCVTSARHTRQEEVAAAAKETC